MTALAAADYEMEEGEIVDELDDLSDISSEEEFLLRQRLEVLENYNNVLERKKAKRSSIGSGIGYKKDVMCDLSEVSTSEFDDSYIHHNRIKAVKHSKHTRPKKRKEIELNEEHHTKRKKEYRKKPTRAKKKVVSDSSEESEDEYRNKRKKLADAVLVRDRNDKSSLTDRLRKMLHPTQHLVVPMNILNIPSIDTVDNKAVEINNKIDKLFNNKIVDVPIDVEINTINAIKLSEKTKADVAREETKDIQMNEPIEISTDDDKEIVNQPIDVVDGVIECLGSPEKDKMAEQDSEEDLELLRQHALNTKTKQNTEVKIQTIEHKLPSEDEDSDTAELRLICLKSALLKKAIEMKQKQKLQKKLSQSNLDDDLFTTNFSNTVEPDNNTDIESVDMEIGSDGDEKTKIDEHKNETETVINTNTAKEDELDEDEDLLRAKLLTSLSKNLPNLVNPELLETLSKDKETLIETFGNKTERISNKSTESLGNKQIDTFSSKEIETLSTNTIENLSKKESQMPKKTLKISEEKRFIIKLDDTDSEGEHEATKNLTKMHMKLSEQIDFQQKLDIFLKSTRMEVEKTKLPDVVQQPVAKKPEKFVAKVVNHLPKSEQIEYKNLVKRMAELEKIKQSRQAAMNIMHQNLLAKDTLKPRNVTIPRTINANVEERISLSRKKIAEESSKMLKLKEEATKLSQKYKIAATELRNISTAITLNKKQQRSIQNSLAKIRLQHQALLRSSTHSLHSKINGRTNISVNKTLTINKLQKENTPKDDYKNPTNQKTVKVSVVNDISATKLSVQVDVANNKKTVKIPIVKDAKTTDRIVLLSNKERIDSKEENLDSNRLSVQEKDEGKEGVKGNQMSDDDYISPLVSIGVTTWMADPNAILCPFEVGGQCKDPDCKYLHTHTLQ